MGCDCQQATSNCGCSNPVSLLRNLTGPTGAKGDTGVDGISGTSVLYNKYFDGSINPLYSNDATTLQHILLSNDAVPIKLTYSLAANTLVAEGDFIEIECGITQGVLTNKTSNDTYLYINFGGTTILTERFIERGNTILKARISRVTDNIQRINTEINRIGIFNDVKTYFYNSTTKNLTTSLDISIECIIPTIANVTANLIQAKYLTITKYLV